MAVCAAAPAPAGDGTFPTEPPGSPYSAGTNPRSVAIGDFNSDGRQDLALANELGGVTVRLGAGNGTFPTEPPGSPFAAGDLPASVAIGDFNSDGKEDLAVADEGGGVTVRLGAGDGTFASEPPGSPFAAGGNPLDVAIGDFNSDGSEDLAVAKENGGVTVRLGAGDGRFPTEPAGSPYGAGTQPRSVAVGDFNSDGRQDLAVASYGGGVTIRLGAGNGTFATEPPGSPFDAGPTPLSVAVGEFNADAREDLAFANLGGGVTIRLGAGDGTFATEPVGSPYGAGAKFGSVAVGDFDSDGDEDLAVQKEEGGGVTVRLGAGDGTFATEPAGSPFAAGEAPAAVAIGDFDADGNEDLAVPSYGHGVTIRLGGGTPPLAGNLLRNGGFEGQGAGRLFTESPAIPGWQRTGGMTFARYGILPSTIFPARLDSPRYLTGGQSFLWGGNSTATGGTTSAFQTVDVSGRAASIDAGLARASLSAYLGGGNVHNDRMAASAAFLTAGGAVLGSLQIGPVTNTERRNLSTLVRRAGGARVPPGTRQVRVTLTAIDVDVSYSSAFADNVKLALEAPNFPRFTQAAGPPAFGAATRVTLRLAKKRIPARGPLPVLVANANAFPVTGRLAGETTGRLALGQRKRRVRLRARPISIPTRARRTVRLALPKPLRRLLARRGRLSLRLRATVIDPAGNRRKLRKRVAPRVKKSRKRGRRAAGQHAREPTFKVVGS